MDDAAASRPILSSPVLAWHDGKVDHKTNHDSYYCYYYLLCLGTCPPVPRRSACSVLNIRK